MVIWWAAVLFGITAATGSTGRAVTVSAAISLSEVLEEAAAAYRQRGGGPVRFNFAGSNALARQIANGAPVDLFISADHAQMAFVEKAGQVLEGSLRVVASNQLAVVTSGDRVAEVREAFPRAGPAIRRLAVGDPAAVPAGVYAKGYLERQGLWNAYAPRLIPTGNVRSALAAVENGSVDAAIVYVTDVQRARNVRVVFTVARDQAPIITYPAAVLLRSPNRAAAGRFLDFLQSSDGQRIFARHGFLPPPPR